MPCRQIVSGLSLAIDWPNSRIAPRRGGRNPTMVLMHVLFARAVSAEQCEQLAGLYIKRDALQHMAVAVKAVHVFERQRVRSECRARS